MNWISTKERMPEPETPVLVFFLENKRRCWTRAEWVPKFHCEDLGGYEGDTEYSEEYDANYWPEGWYEWNHQEETHWKLDAEILFWAEVELPC